MAVVINEFEVAPAETRASAPEATPPDGAGGKRKDVQKELERHLQKRALRATRLRAV